MVEENPGQMFGVLDTLKIMFTPGAALIRRVEANPTVQKVEFNVLENIRTLKFTAFRDVAIGLLGWGMAGPEIYGSWGVGLMTIAGLDLATTAVKYIITKDQLTIDRAKLSQEGIDRYVAAKRARNNS